MNSEKHILHALKCNDETEVEQAFCYLYNKYCRLVYICILSLVKDRRDAEELTDDTFIKIYNNRYTIQERDSIKYYVVTIAKNIALDFLRKKHIDTILDDDYVFKCAEATDNNDLTNLRIKLHQYLEPCVTEIVIDHIVFGYKFNEIANHYKVSVSTIKTKYFRAMKKLHKEMRDSYE